MLSIPVAETLWRNADPDADWEAPLSPRDEFARIARRSVPPILSNDYTIASPCPKLLALLTVSCQILSGWRGTRGWAMRTITIRVLAVDFAERIAAMRIWLDEHRVEPSRFKYSDDGNDLLIDVSFEVADDAAAFSVRFNGESTQPS